MVSRDHFSKLSSEIVDERIHAATSLIKELTNENNQQEWEYALTRLIKGLITTRQTAKLGFSMALTEVVNQLVSQKQLTIDQYLDRLTEVTQVKSNMKGKEERAVLFGRLFGLQVLLNSKIILQSKEEELLRFINVLVELSNTKSWIREVATASLIQVIRNLPERYATSLLLMILQKVNDLGLNLSTEGLAIYLSIDPLLRSDVAAQINNSKSNWKEGDPMRKGNLPVLAKVLKDVEVIVEETDGKELDTKKKQQKSSWSSRLPFVWDLIVENFANKLAGDEYTEEHDADNERKRKKVEKSNTKSKNKNRSKGKSASNDKAQPEMITLKEFYKVVVDETLFAEKSSHERKYWGFEIFMKFMNALELSLEVNLELEAGPGLDVAFLFTPNFMRCLINQSSHKSRLLHESAKRALQSIVQNCNIKSRDIASTVLKCLLDESKGGCWNFDLVTRSNTVDRILDIQNHNLLPTLLEKFDIALREQTTIPDGDKFSNDNVLKWCLDKIVHLIKRNLHGDELEDVFTMLVKLSFFETTASPNIRKLAQEKLNVILAEVVLRTHDKELWAYFCFQQLVALDKSHKCLVEFDDELLQVRDETITLIQTTHDLEKERESSAGGTLKMFELLFSMCFLQLHQEDEEIVQIINELKLVFEKQFVLVAEVEPDNEIDPAVVMTEILLSFISRQVNLLKRLSMIIWEHYLCGEDAQGKLRINDASFQLLLDVLIAKENKEGQKLLFENENEHVAEGSDEEESEDGEGEGDSDLLKDGNADDEEDDSEEEEEEEDSEDENNANSTMTELDKETNLKLAKALGIPTAESGEVKFDELSDSDSSNDDYESDSMNDDEMMAMDDQLSKIFKERQDILNNVTTGNKRKIEVMEAKKLMVFFKNRVLDLLEVFCRKHPNSQYNLTFIEPIITLMNLTLDKNLGVKAHKLLKNRISKTKINPDQVDDIAEFSQKIISLIEKLQLQASTTKSSNQSVISGINQSCIILSKNLVALDPNYIDAVADIYSQSLKKWTLDPESRIQPSLFFDFVNWISSKKKNKQ